MEEKLTIPSEVTRPALYRNVYKGSFKDKNPDMRPVSIYFRLLCCFNF